MATYVWYKRRAIAVRTNLAETEVMQVVSLLSARKEKKLADTAHKLYIYLLYAKLYWYIISLDNFYTLVLDTYHP